MRFMRARNIVYKLMVKGSCEYENEDKKKVEEYLKERSYKTKRVVIINSSDCRAPTEDEKDNSRFDWCPFCHSYRKFSRDTTLKVRTCDYCGISENFYWYKVYNRKW